MARINKLLSIFTLLAMAWLFMFTANQEMIKSLEGSLASVIGAILGGIVSAATFLFTIVRDYINRVLLDSEISEERKALIINRFRSTTKAVHSDLLLLTGCLASSVILPILRENTNFIKPFKIPNEILINPQDIIIFSEAITILLSILIIWEIISLMFLVIEKGIEK